MTAEAVKGGKWIEKLDVTSFREKKVKRLLTSAATVALLVTTASASVWNIDQAHSHVGFKVSHMVISKISGQFNDFAGTINFDGKNFQSASTNITIKTASIDTKNSDRDNHLRGSDFFLADSFPQITFKSKKVSGGKDNKFTITGDLSIRGITKKVTIDAEFNGTVKDPWGNTRAGFAGTAKINRQDFGISWNKTLDKGGIAVGNEVTILLEIEAILQE